MIRLFLQNEAKKCLLIKHLELTSRLKAKLRDDARAFLRIADEALYAAKARRRNRVETAPAS